MPGFVKTDEELDRIAAVFNPYRYFMDVLSLEFTTTWTFARWVLPPCFEPVGDEAGNRADASAAILSMQCCHYGPFEASDISLRCRFRNIQGYYLLHTTYSTDAHAYSGRALWGGPQKLGVSRLRRDGDHYFGSCERFGRRLLEIDADIDGPERAPLTRSGRAFALKMFPSSTGRGLAQPPVVNVYKTHEEIVSLRRGSGVLRWGHSESDPVYTIPISSVGPAWATTSEFRSGDLTEFEVADPDGIYPRYYWGTYMDDPTFEPIPARWRDVVAANGTAHDMAASGPTVVPDGRRVENNVRTRSSS
jgi:hypothetical protein